MEIPKENRKTRLLSIYCYEDKLVQEALKRILEEVFEPHFYDEMMGFRPRRGYHRAIRRLNAMLEMRPTNYVLDADIKSFFNHIDHEWGQIYRITNQRPQYHKAGKANAESRNHRELPIRGNRRRFRTGERVLTSNRKYLHALCIGVVVQGMCRAKLKGYGGLVVYADDFVACFHNKEEAEEFYKHLKSRMEHFGMTPEESKTRLIEFGRYAEERCRREGGSQRTLHFGVLHITVPMAGTVNSG